MTAVEKNPNKILSKYMTQDQADALVDGEHIIYQEFESRNGTLHRITGGWTNENGLAFYNAETYGCGQQDGFVDLLSSVIAVQMAEDKDSEKIAQAVIEAFSMTLERLDTNDEKFRISSYFITEDDIEEFVRYVEDEADLVLGEDGNYTRSPESED